MPLGAAEVSQNIVNIIKGSQKHRRGLDPGAAQQVRRPAMRSTAKIRLPISP
jgi:hypothetical protein